MVSNTIKFNLEPKCQNIDMAADRGISFLKSHGFSDDAVQVPAMVLRKLIKSSINFGRYAPAANEIAVCLQIDKNTYTIEVTNPVCETCSDRLKELDKTIQFIRGYQDPYEAYSRRLSDVAATPFNTEVNDLDLVKVAYEGGAILDFFVNEDNFLSLSAVGSLEGDG